MSKGELTKQNILEEATRLASRVGLGGLTIGSLAEQAGLSKSGLFAHFQSKESLQLQVLSCAADRFVEHVIRPALKAPRGEPRVRKLFERCLSWCRGDVLPGGCPLIDAARELDDQPGPLRDALVRNQRDWLDTIAQVFRSGIGEGQFRPDADVEQLALDFEGAMLAYSWASRLLGYPAAEERAWRSLEALLRAARKPLASRGQAQRRSKKPSFPSSRRADE